MNRRHLLAAAAALLPAIAHAQAAQPASGATLGEIVVTAQRRAERLTDVPISITALSGETLKAAGISDTRSLAQVTPGLAFTAQGAWAEPNLRGVSTANSAAGQEGPIAIYVDDVYQVSQLASFFQLPDVSHVEVLKGPQGTLFGRNAEGGAIRIETRSPSFTPSADLTASAGYYTGGKQSHKSSDLKFTGFLTGPIVEDKLAASVSFLRQEVQGYLTNIATGGRDGHIYNSVVRAKLLFTPTDKIDLLVAGWYGQTTDDAATNFSVPTGNSSVTAVNAAGAPSNPGGIIPTQPWTVAHDNPTFVHTRVRGALLKGTFRTEEGTLNSVSSYNQAHNVARVNVAAGFIPAGPVRDSCYLTFRCVDYLVVQPAESWTQEFSWASREYGRLNFVAGVFLFHSDEDQQAHINSVVLPGVVRNDARVVTTSYAAFVEGHYKMTDALTVILGGRYSYEKKKGSFAARYPGPYVPTARPHWDAFTPRASLVYKVDPYSNAYATYSKGFKSGVINGGAPFNIIDPETLNAFEVGYKRATADYSISLAAFYYKYRNQQVQQFLNLAFITNNAARSTIYGLDFDGAVRLGPDLKLRAGASYLPRARYDRYAAASFNGLPIGPTGFPTVVADVSHKRILKTPKVTATAGLDYTPMLSAGQLKANVSLYHSSSYFWQLNYRIKTNPYTTVNSQIGFTPTGSRFTFSVWGKNLTNSAHKVAVLPGDSFADTGIYEPPQEVGVSLNYAF